jgi:hypothetical protein
MALLDIAMTGWASGQEARPRMFYEEMQVTVDRAAELLPDPPRPGNLEGYARWEALTLDTGRLLARLLGADIDLLRSLIDDETLTPVQWRQRRRLLLRVALLWACQTVQRKPAELGTAYRHGSRSAGIAQRTADSSVPVPLIARPIWLDAR